MAIAVTVGAGCLHGQGFHVPGGSDGTDRELHVTDNLEIELPADGVLNYTKITIDEGKTLTFKRNPRNTPVYLLATGDVIINGTIDVSGQPWAWLVGGRGGPGGYDGGNPGPVGMPGGSGLGPGGGRPGTGHFADVSSAGAGVYAQPIKRSVSTNHGKIYGGPLLIPLSGGSGGGGGANGGVGGGGGGGAILVCSDTKIVFQGTIKARGGDGVNADISGSGGAIRLVAPKLVGTGTADAGGGLRLYGGGTDYGSAGRIRFDTYDRTEFNPSRSEILGEYSNGSFVVGYRPDWEPTLRVLRVTKTDGTEPLPPEGPIAPGSSPLEILLPTDSPSLRIIQVEVARFFQKLEVEVALKPWNGAPETNLVIVDNTSGSPTTVEVPMNIPGNTLLHVEAYKR
ncbi:MAG: hypothetical protein JNK85_29875 [Verrucomicrobiales bacterium]|nr:hypothetical protein [Verrucomicrobiales bacterium]